MTRSRKLCIAALPFLFAACGPRDDARVGDTGVVGTTTPAPGMTPAPAMEQQVQLAAVGNSGVRGEATIAESAQQTRVVVRLTGGAANVAHPAHIHQGTCEGGGPVAAPLESVSADGTGGGSSTSTVDLPMGTVMNGQHFVQVHNAEGTPVACGNIPAHQM